MVDMMVIGQTAIDTVGGLVRPEGMLLCILDTAAARQRQGGEKR